MSEATFGTIIAPLSHIGAGLRQVAETVQG